ncbi:MAG TPA: Ldh family oxidoreductase, partial [Anaerolineae bacterium]|nr:Ldh family oxidoreductase [Anaerolineae bacterium]
GTPSDIAQYVSSSLVDSSLKGVDSHGVIRVSSYIDQIASGWIKPAARPEIQKETPTTAIVRGNSGFGIWALGYAMDLAIQKAKANQVASVGLIESTHTGRLGQFVETAAKEGLFAMLTGGGAHGHPRHSSVAPYGGAKRIMATNPYAFGLPDGRFGPVVVDIATSQVAEGKLQVYRAKREELPPGWILDKAGRPSTNVEDFYGGGMLLPAAGHKGYSLALVAELLGYALLGKPHELNWFIVALDIAAFRPIAEFVQASEELLQKLKEVPPAPGFDEVLIPGEPEARAEEQRAAEGIPIPDETWQKIQEAARRVGVDPEIA